MMQTTHESRSLGALRQPGAVLLVSCYELGHQPHGITMPKAFLERAGFEPATMDLAVDGYDVEKVRRARLVAISVPMHTALRLGEGTAHRIREAHPDCHICFHGHYAVLHAEHLRSEVADSVLGGELEARFTQLVESLASEASSGAPSRWVGAGDAAATAPAPEPLVLEALDFPVPSRSALPPLDRYAHLVHGETHVVTGYTEASCRRVDGAR